MKTEKELENNAHRKSKCVFFGITSNLAFSVGAVIIGIEKHSPALIDKYIIYTLPDDALMKEDKEALSVVTKNVEFRTFYPYVENSEGTLKELISTYSPLVLCKFKIFELLKEYEQVLWLDSDILVQGDISPIFKYDSLAWRKGIYSLTNISAPNGGVILANREILSLGLSSDDLKEIFNEAKNKALRIAIDEKFFSLLAYKYDIKVNELPIIYNNILGYNENIRKGVIIHCMGQNKFWNDNIWALIYPEWKENYNEYLKLGGLPYCRQIFNLNIRSESELYSSMVYILYWELMFRDFHLKKGFSVGETTTNVVRINIDGISKQVYYEFKGLRDNVRIALYIEEPSWMTDVLKMSLQIYACDEYEIEKLEKGVRLKKIVSADTACDEMSKLMDKTIDFVRNYHNYYEQTNTRRGGQ